MMIYIHIRPLSPYLLVCVQCCRRASTSQLSNMSDNPSLIVCSCGEDPKHVQQAWLHILLFDSQCIVSYVMCIDGSIASGCACSRHSSLYCGHACTIHKMAVYAHARDAGEMRFGCCGHAAQVKAVALSCYSDTRFSEHQIYYATA